MLWPAFEQPLVERVHQLLVVHAPGPLRHVLVGVVADRVALEAVGLQLLDGALHLIHPAGLAGGEDGVAHAAARAARGVVDLLAGVELHLVGEEPIGRLVGRRAADQRDLGVAVEEDLLEPVGVFQAVEALLGGVERRVPAGAADRAAHLHEAHVAGVVAQEMGVDVHDELVAERGGAGLGALRLLRLGAGDAEDGAVDLVHRQEGGGHAGGGGKEAAARAVLLGADLVGHGLDAGFHLALLRRLRDGRELVGGDHLRRDRRGEHGLLGGAEFGDLVVGQEAHGWPFSLRCAGRAWRRLPCGAQGGRTTALRPLPVPARPGAERHLTMPHSPIRTNRRKRP